MRAVPDVDLLQPLAQLLVTSRLVELARLVVQRAAELFPGLLVGRVAWSAAIEALAHHPTEVVVAERRPRETQYDKVPGEQTVLEEIEQSRHELAMGQVAGSPEDDDGAGWRRPLLGRHDDFAVARAD